MARVADSVTDSPLQRLIERFDASVFEVGRPEARISIEGAEPQPRVVLLEDGRACIADSCGEVDAELVADTETWASVANDLRDGMAAFRAGQLRIRRDLHLGSLRSSTPWDSNAPT